MNTLGAVLASFGSMAAVLSLYELMAEESEQPLRSNMDTYGGNQPPRSPWTSPRHRYQPGLREKRYPDPDLLFPTGGLPDLPPQESLEDHESGQVPMTMLERAVAKGMMTPVEGTKKTITTISIKKQKRRCKYRNRHRTLLKLKIKYKMWFDYCYRRKRKNKLRCHICDIRINTRDECIKDSNTVLYFCSESCKYKYLAI